MINRGQGRYRPQGKRSGFTLMEVLLVLAILVILGSMAVQMFTGTQEQAEKKAARTQVALFERAIDLYKFHTKQMPSSLDDLIKRPSDSTLAENWAGPYIKGSKIPDDPWGHPYKYLANGKQNPESYDVWSMGPDGKDGEDDVGNWES